LLEQHGKLLHLSIGNAARHDGKIGKAQARPGAGSLQCKVIGLVRLLAVGSIADDTRDARLFQRGDICGSQLVGHTQAR